MPKIAPRSNSSSYDETSMSPRMASHTLVGMVLGVLCLFGIVLAYQFLPRKKKPINKTRQHVARPADPPPSFSERLRTQCTTLLHKVMPERSPRETDNPRNARNLRTLYLSPKTRQSNRDRAREMFQTTHRLNLSIPPMRNLFTPPQSPHTPNRRHYAPLDDDNEPILRPQRPAAVLLSPWSPSEQDYPYTDSTMPSPLHSSANELITPPRMNPPPRVYVPETPLRGGFHLEREDEWEKIGSDPFADPKDDVDVKTLVKRLRKRQKELEEDLKKEGVFVIGDEDWDSDSDSDSLYSTPSAPKR